MRRRSHLIVSLALISASMGAASISSPQQAPTNTAASTIGVGQTPLAYLPRLEVRLRKVHLVRPDLIPYPIAIEVDC